MCQAPPSPLGLERQTQPSLPQRMCRGPWGKGCGVKTGEERADGPLQGLIRIPEREKGGRSDSVASWGGGVNGEGRHRRWSREASATQGLGDRLFRQRKRKRHSPRKGPGVRGLTAQVRVTGCQQAATGFPLGLGLKAIDNSCQACPQSQASHEPPKQGYREGEDWPCHPALPPPA